MKLNRITSYNVCYTKLLRNFLLLTPFYTNVFLEQEKYGTITELYSYTAFLLVLLTYGMETTFFRFSNKYGNNNIFNVVQSVITVTSVLFISAILFTYNSIRNNFV